MPTISVHVVTHNSAATLTRCLEGLLAQQGVDFGVYIIDNASTDDTLSLLGASGLTPVANAQNVGYAAAHNQAIAQTDSVYILTLNPDVWLAPGYLRAMQAALDADARLGSAAGCLLRVEGLAESPVCVDGAGLFMRRNRRQGLRYEGRPIAERPTRPAAIFGPDGAAAFYRRAMLEDIRLEDEVFDTDFFMHKEDVDICWRARLRGWSSVYVPDAVAHHVRGFRPGQRGRVSTAMRWYSTRNRYLLMLKNEQLPHFLRDLWAIALYDLGIAAYLLLRERPTLRAYRSAWALRRRMLHKRWLIQAGRRVDWRAMRRWFRAW